MPRRQHGFTLVEIAIVLVVIGLLLGGILKGQDLVNGARVRNLADMNAGIQAAYYGFMDRYRQVPGDMTAAAAASAIGDAAITAGGDANGRIDPADWGEASALWAHLTRAGFLQGSYDGGADERDEVSRRCRGAAERLQRLHAARPDPRLLDDDRRPDCGSGGAARSRPRRQHSGRHRPGARPQDRRSAPPDRCAALHRDHHVLAPRA